jgi:PAS domain S-box-containing protein
MIIGNIPAIVFKGYADWSIDFLDHKIEEMLGYPKADFDSRQLKWDKLILDEDILPAKMIFIQALKTNKSYVREYRIINKALKITWIQERSRIVLNHDGKIEYISGIFFDITELKEAEKSLEQLRNQLELILNAAWEGILGLDVNGKHTFINPTAAKMLGYEVKELIGKHSHSIWHHSKADGSPYPEEECPIDHTFRHGIINHVRDEVFWRKDGTSFQVAYSGTPLMEEGRIIGAVVTFWDISERKRAELERERLINELQDALTQVKTLKGMLPICAHCKKIRDDEGYWQTVEKYIYDRSAVEFSHGICPDCLKKHYPSFIKAEEPAEKNKND